MDLAEGRSAEIEIIPNVRHVDATHITWHGNYPAFIEDAQRELFGNCGVQLSKLDEQGLSPEPWKYSMEYKSPSRLGERLSVKSEISKLSKEELTVTSEVRRVELADGSADDEVICTNLCTFCKADSKKIPADEEGAQKLSPLTMKAKTSYKHVGIFQHARHENFFEWFENARVETLNKVNCKLEELRENYKRVPVVGSIDFTFEEGAGINKTINIESWISELSDSHIRFEAAFSLGSKNICRGSAMMFLINEQTHEPAIVPKYMRDAVSGKLPDEFDVF